MQFHGGKRHGLGRFTWAATKETFEGEWANDMRQARPLPSAPCKSFSRWL